MPIHDLGYRAWQGTLVSPALRFWTITTTGARLAWQSRWLRRILFFAWLPAIFIAIGFFVYEQYLLHAVQAEALTVFMPDLVPELSRSPDQLAALAERLHTDRHWVWAQLLWTFFRYPQGLVLVLVVGLVAPPLISQDVRTRAFMLYFSRPITRLEYLVGKVLVVWGYILMITTLPALSLYLVGVLFSPELKVVTFTWDLPLRVVGASAVLMIPTTALALALSSLTSATWRASFAWFAIWVVGWVSYVIIFNSNFQNPPSIQWTLVSLYHTLGRVQGWVFGLHKGGFTRDILSATIELSAITVLSLAVLVRRISSPMRI